MRTVVRKDMFVLHDRGQASAIDYHMSLLLDKKKKKMMIPSSLLLLVCSTFLSPHVLAFSAVPDNRVTPPSTPNDGPQKKHEKKLNFHQVLQKVGKTVFRPGGSQATRVLHEWAQLQKGDKALEMSAGLGTGGMALSKRFGCTTVLTDQYPDRLVLAKKLAHQKGVADLVQIRTLDMRKIAATLDPQTDQFDAVMVEASMSHQPDIVKEKILGDLSAHTNQLLLHEIALRNCSDAQALQIKQQVGSALAIGFYPLSIEKWRDLLDRNGYQITRLEYGPIRVLNPKNLLQDEGPRGVAKIAYNLATHPELRERVRSTKQMVDAHKDTLGFVILRAVKKQQ